MTWRGNELKRRARQGAETGVMLAAELVKARSMEVVPLDEGTLLRSASIEQDGLSAVIGYDTPYAKIQHEAVGFHHPNGRQAKYLENPLYDSEKDIQQIVNDQVRAAIGG